MVNCLFCQKVIRNALSFDFIFSFKPFKRSLLCEECLSAFEKIDQATSCLGCSNFQNQKTNCNECQRWKGIYPALNFEHISLFTYNEIAREYMKQFKIQENLILGEVFSQQIHDALQPYLKTHRIVPIPLSVESLKIRDYNPVEVFLDYAQIPYHNLLVNNHVGIKQAQKNRSERLKTRQSFILSKEINKERFKNQKILLIDDIYTTGQTIFHAKNLIFKEIYKENSKIVFESFSIFR